MLLTQFKNDLEKLGVSKIYFYVNKHHEKVFKMVLNDHHWFIGGDIRQYLENALRTYTLKVEGAKNFYVITLN